jgi:hypothetical protein
VENIGKNLSRIDFGAIVSGSPEGAPKGEPMLVKSLPEEKQLHVPPVRLWRWFGTGGQ